jgi:hypothetical protein
MLCLERCIRNDCKLTCWCLYISTVLDDTCKTMHGTQAGLEVDRKFLDSARQLHANNAHFRPVPNAFVVKHYAGEVTVRLEAFHNMLCVRWCSVHRSISWK